MGTLVLDVSLDSMAHTDIFGLFGTKNVRTP